jgi:hypothetical protein
MVPCASKGQCSVATLWMPYFPVEKLCTMIYLAGIVHTLAVTVIKQFQGSLQNATWVMTVFDNELRAFTCYFCYTGVLQGRMLGGSTSRAAGKAAGIHCYR